MSRAPFVMAKATSAFDRNAEMYDTTIGWRFVNPKMKGAYGDDTMPSTAENVAQEWQVSREDQDAFAVRSQQKASAAQGNGRFAAEIVPVSIPQRKGEPLTVDRDEHPRLTSVEALGRLKPIVRSDGHGDGRQCLGRQRRRRCDDRRQRGSRPAPRAHAPRPHRRRRDRRRRAPHHGHRPGAGLAKAAEAARPQNLDMDVIEINEAFAAQALPVLREFGLPDDAPHVNPNGGAIALGHPLGMSGARLALTATEELHRTGGRYALCAMCIGVGQGIAMVIERV